MEMTSDEASIAKVVESYRTSVYEKDVDTFVALYRENVIVFDMWGLWSYDGADAWRAMAMEWLALWVTTG